MDYTCGGRFPQYADFRPGGKGTNDYGETYEQVLNRLRAEGLTGVPEERNTEDKKPECSS